jgi:hypothetical protein
MEISKFLSSKEGSVVISIVLGLGLAAAFRHTCKKGNCIVIKGPKMTDVQDNYYRVDDACYKYTPYVVECQKDSVQNQ